MLQSLIEQARQGYKLFCDGRSMEEWTERDLMVKRESAVGRVVHEASQEELALLVQTALSQLDYDDFPIHYQERLRGMVQDLAAAILRSRLRNDPYDLAPEIHEEVSSS